MVTRIYTPLVQPYGRTGKSPSEPGGMDVPESEQPQVGENAQTAGANTTLNAELSRPSAGLQSVLEQQRSQRIPLSAILKDFHSTMTALGADDATRAEVGAYLNVANLQAGKEKPEVPFIKHTLRTAAGSLDQFITGVLGQPSKVVKEWVDALLMQDIDYGAPSDTPPGEASATSAPQADAEGAVPGNLTLTAKPASLETPPPATKTGAQLKALVDAAKTQYQSGQPEQAQAMLDQALATLDGKNRPDWEGKIHQMRGRFYDRAGDWRQSLQAYETAAAKFSEAGLVGKQSGALSAQASILEDRGRLPEATALYQQVVSLDEQAGDQAVLSRSLNDLGSIYLRQGLAKDAIPAFQRAYREASASGAADPKLLSDVLSNLGAAYRSDFNYAYAEKAYRLSLKNARAAGDKLGYGSTLQQLAAMYVEANQPANAMKALEKLSALNA